MNMYHFITFTRGVSLTCVCWTGPGKEFEMDPETFTPAHLFAMELSHYGDLISDIVGGAVKELGIENGVRDVAEVSTEGIPGCLGVILDLTNVLNQVDYPCCKFSFYTLFGGGGGRAHISLDDKKNHSNRITCVHCV